MIYAPQSAPTLPPSEPAFRNVSEGQIVAYCRKLWKESRDYSRSILDEIPRLYDAFSVVNTGDVAAYRNNIGLPILVSMVLTDTARQANALFGGNEIIEFVGCPPESRGIARKNALLVANQLRDARSFIKGVDFLNNAHLYGTAVARVGWSYLERLRNFRVETPSGIQVVQHPMIVRDGPDWINIDLLDWGPQPHVKYVHDMERCQFRYYEDFDTLWEMNESHRAKFGEDLFIPGALQRLQSRRAPTLDDLKQARLGQTPSLAMQGSGPSRFHKPVEIIETIGLVPAEMAIDGDRNRVILMANDGTILRNDPAPYWSGNLPAIVYCPAPDPTYHYGIGKGRLLEPLQAAASRLINQKLDNSDLGANMMWAVDITRAPNIANINSKPGRVIPCRGPVNEILQPIPVNWQGVQHAMQEVAELREFAQMAAGISEAGTMGIGGGDRQTAREFLGRQEAANTRLGLEAQLASVFVEDLANWFRDLNQQYLTLPAQIQLIGDAAITDPVSGLPANDPDAMTIIAGDLIHNWKARATGPLSLLSKGLQRQDAMQLLQMASANPVMLQMVNWAGFTKRLFSLFEGFDSPDMIVQQVPAITQMANQIGMTPEQLAGGDVQAMQGGMSPFGGAGGQAMGGGGVMPANMLGGGA